MARGQSYVLLSHPTLSIPIIPSSSRSYQPNPRTPAMTAPPNNHAVSKNRHASMTRGVKNHLLEGPSSQVLNIQAKS
ncbi:hypothetical protein E4U53_007219 [Claviceps sorghi]|nr:hypothetical protein E4U53_007219 [Claviceps sorghi]